MQVWKYLGIGYLVIGLLYNGFLFLGKHGAAGAAGMAPSDSRVNGGLPETLLWPLYMAGVIRSDKLPPIREKSSRAPTPGFVKAVEDAPSTNGKRLNGAEALREARRGEQQR